MKRRFNPRVLICLLLPFTLALAHGGGVELDPPGYGGNGPFGSQSIEFLSHLPLADIGGGPGNVWGSDCWGWTDPDTGKEYAISCLTNKTSFIDISDPINPKYLGSLPSQTGNSAYWRDVKTYQNYAFVVSDGNGNHGMQIFDLTQLRTVDPNNPQTFSNTAYYNNGVNSAHNIAINEDTGFAYIVGSARASGGPHIVDISNPLNPTYAGEYSGDGYSHDIQVVTYHGPDSDYTGHEIAVGSNEDTVTILDVTDKNNISMISRNSYANDRYTHQGWLSEDHRYFYFGDELDESNFGFNTRTHIFDCLDLDNPVYVGYYSGTTPSIDHNLYVKGNLIYEANYTSGLHVLQMVDNDPTNLTEVAHFDTYAAHDNPTFNGAWSSYPYFQSGTILVNDIQGGMFLVRLAGLEFNFPQGRPDVISPVGEIEFTVEVNGLFGVPESGTLMLHVDRGNGFESFAMNETSENVYDIQFPPTECGSTVAYYFSAQSTSGGTCNSPSDAPNNTYSALSANSVDVSFDDNFETNQGWTVTGNALDGQWQRGIPVGGGDRGDPPTDADGSGQCYLTGNAAGNSDVDEGSTILTSPILDGSAPGAQISYFRWYSNDFGGAPNEDIFVVEISNDGGSTWVNLETVGPDGPETSGGWYDKSFLISDYISPTNNMRVRFNASDVGGGSVVEAGVDGVQISSIGCDAGATIVPPSSFTVYRGVQIGGTLDDVIESDDSYMRFNPGLTLNSSEAPVWLIFDASLPTESPISLESVVEAQAGTPGLTGTLEAWNWSNGSYDVVDVSDAGFNSDVTVTVDLTAGISDYVQPGTAAVRTRVGWRKTGFTINYPWEIRVDQLVWNVIN